MKKPRKGDIVLVEWVDIAMLHGTWHDRSAMEEHDIVACRSVGYVGKLTKKKIVLYASEGRDLVSHVDALPIGVIRSIRVLERPEKPK